MSAGLELVLIALGLAFLLVAGLAIAAAVGAGHASRAEELRHDHYLTPEDLAPMTDADRERLERQLLLEDDGSPPAA